MKQLTQRVLVLILVFIPSIVHAQRVDWERISTIGPNGEFEVINDTTFLGLNSSNDTPFQAGLLRSTDRGLTWTTEAAWGIVTEDNQGQFHGNYVASILFKDASAGWAFGGNEGRPVLFFSSDIGKSWKKQNFAVPEIKVTRFEDISDDSAYVYFVAMYGSAPDTRGVYSVNKVSNVIDTIITWAEIAKQGVPYVDGASLRDGDRFVVGRSEKFMPFLLFKSALDSTWTKLPIDSLPSKILRIQRWREKMFVSNETRLYTLDSMRLAFDSVIELGSYVRSFTNSSQFLLSVLDQSPRVLYRSSQSNVWVGIGVPELQGRSVKVLDDSILFIANSSGIHRGALKKDSVPTLQVFLDPNARNITVDYHQLLSDTLILRSYATIDHNIHLRIDSKNKILLSDSEYVIAAGATLKVPIQIFGDWPGKEIVSVYSISSDQELIGTFSITVPTARVRTKDTLFVHSVLSNRDKYFKALIENDGELPLKIYGISLDGQPNIEFDTTFQSIWRSNVSIYWKGLIPDSFGRLVLQSNSTASPDTLVYFLDSASLRPSVINLTQIIPQPPVTSSRLTGIAMDGNNTYLQTHEEYPSQNGSVHIYRNNWSALTHLLSFDGDRNANDEVWTFGQLASNNLATVVKVIDSVGKSPILTRFDTNGAILSSESLVALRYARIVNGRVHIRKIGSAWMEELPGNRYWWHGESAQVSNGISTFTVEGKGNYDAHVEWTNGNATPILSAIDSNGSFYLIAKRDIGYGGYSDVGSAFETVLVSSSNWSLRVASDDLGQLEVAPNGEVYLLHNDTITKYFGGVKLYDVHIQHAGLMYVNAKGKLFTYSGNDGLTLRLHDDSGKVVWTSKVNVWGSIKEVQITREGDIYALLTADQEVVLLQLNSAGKLETSAYIDGGALASDEAVQFLRTDTSIIVASNQAKSGSVYELAWQHPQPALSVKRAAPVSLQTSIYPNPAQTSVHVATSNPVEHVIVTDALGSQVANSESAMLSIAHLPSGVYTVSAYTGKGVERAKLVVQH